MEVQPWMLNQRGAMRKPNIHRLDYIGSLIITGGGWPFHLSGTAVWHVALIEQPDTERNVINEASENNNNNKLDTITRNIFAIKGS